jgi:hypothetical protein
MRNIIQKLKEFYHGETQREELLSYGQLGVSQRKRNSNKNSVSSVKLSRQGQPNSVSLRGFLLLFVLFVV